MMHAGLHYDQDSNGLMCIARSAAAGIWDGKRFVASEESAARRAPQMEVGQTA